MSKRRRRPRQTPRPRAEPAPWGGRRVQALRARFAELLPLPCLRCQLPVEAWHRWHLDHALPQVDYPEARWDVEQLWPSHASCNERHGQALATRARLEASSSRFSDPRSDTPRPTSFSLPPSPQSRQGMSTMGPSSGRLSRDASELYADPEEGTP